MVSDLNGVIHGTDEIQKVYSISDTIACGIIGDAQWGILLEQTLLQNANKQINGIAIQFLSHILRLVSANKDLANL